MSDQENKQQFALKRIYIKDLSFEAPGAPEIFQGDWKPEMNLELNNQSKQVDENIYEVVLAITVTVKNKQDTAFVIEIHQAGLFQANGFESGAIHQLLGSYCPNILFPYAREAVTDLAGKGSFPQLLLAPVNFDALYAEAVKRREAESSAETKH